MRPWSWKVQNINIHCVWAIGSLFRLKNRPVFSPSRLTRRIRVGAHNRCFAPVISKKTAVSFSSSPHRFLPGHFIHIPVTNRIVLGVKIGESCSSFFYETLLIMKSVISTNNFRLRICCARLLSTARCLLPTHPLIGLN